MCIATDLTLVAPDPQSGKSRLGVVNPDAVFGGAHLIDLLESGRLTAQGEGRTVKVTVADARRLVSRTSTSRCRA